MQRFGIAVGFLAVGLGCAGAGDAFTQGFCETYPEEFTKSYQQTCEAGGTSADECKTQAEAALKADSTYKDMCGG